MIQQDPVPRGPAFLDFGDFRLDLANRLLYRAGEPVDLTPKAFDTLLVLVRRAGQVVPKDALIEEIWPSSYVSEATLSQNIYILRRLLDPEDTRRWIRTLPRRGYRFEGEVVAVDGDPAAPAGLPEGASAASVGIADIRSLAVLPLRPLRQDEEGVFLGLGIADAVITSLSNLRQLSVRATSAILRYADGVEGGGGDVAAIGRDLGVEGVLEGTVQRSGSRLRVTLQLISVASGVPCWAESFRGDYDDLFVAQDAVAREVVRRLRLTLTQGEASSFARPPTESLEAYRTYVRGRYSWNRRSAADLRRAIELFRQAVSEDPTYARAYSGLADALILLPFYGSARPTDAFRQAREAARRALELDDRLAEARTSLAYTDFIYSRDWPAAESGFLRSLEQDPSYPTACHWYAFMLTALGRHGEAIEMAGRAHHLDPLSLVISTDLALAYYFARRFEEAQAHLAGVVEVAPDFGYAHFALALCFSQMGRHDDAVEAGRRAVEILGDSMAARAALGFSLARGGQVVEARSLLGGGDGALIGGSLRALVLTGLGDSESAFDELDLAIEDRSRFAVLLGVWPAFDPLRGDPRFPDLLRRLSLSGT